MNFTEFNLNEDLMKGVEKAGYTVCTPVQEQVLSSGLNGADLYVQSQTGTGKTAAYLILMLQQMLTKPELAGKKALIMVPTRELAVQVEEEARTLASGTKLKSASFYGGVGYERQTSLLKNGVDIIVGTPGRVIDLQESGAMKLDEVAFLVVDEADRMFDMGFYPDLRTLIKVLPSVEQRQTMLFSATLNTYVKNLAWEYTNDAQEITIEPEHITIEEIDQVLLHVSSDEKTKLLLGILKNEKPESVIIFCNTKRSCEVIAKRLKINGIEAEYIIGDLPQSKRLQVLESFKSGSLTCLVATDVAARGIDVDNLAMVVNYDLPNEAENYVHRIGRTARAGKSGKAYTFCSEQDVYNLPAIERYIGNPIPASMASEEMFAEDASAGIYIKTERYDEEYGDRRSKRDRHDDRRNRKGGKDYHCKDGKNSRRNEIKSRKPAYNRNKERASFEEDLAALSFEERMKLYKEKYAHTSENGENSRDNRRDNRKDNYSKGKKNNSKKDYSQKNKNKSAKGNPKHPAAPDGTALGKNPAKQNYQNTGKGYKSNKNYTAKNNNASKKGSAGLLGIIQKLFGKKNKDKKDNR